MASIFRKPGNSVWWVTYYNNGKRHRHSLKTNNERLARRKLKKIEFDLTTGDLDQTTTTPIGPFLEEFCEHLATIRSSKSYKNDISCLRVFFGPICHALEPKSTHNKRYLPRKRVSVVDKLAHRHVAVCTLEQLTAPIINRFITTRIKRDGIAPKTANRIREVLHVMFNYAIRQHGFRAADKRFPNPAHEVPRRKEAEPEIRFLTHPQIDKQLAALVADPVLQAMVAVYIFAGLRREEAMWLTAQDVTLENGMIRICQKTIDGANWKPKTRKNRRVPISAALRYYLESYDLPSGAWFFPSPTGKRWDPDNFSQRLRKINSEHELAWTCLDFRHTFGSHLAMKGESLYKISELLGNSPEICRRHYAALIPEQMRDTVEFHTPEQLKTPTLRLVSR